MNKRIFLISILCFTVVAGLSYSLSSDGSKILRASQPDQFCLGLEAYEKGDLAEAEQIWKEKLVKLPNADDSTPLFLGTLMKEEGRYDEAEKLLQRAVAASKRMFGVDAWETTIPMRQLAGVYEQQGKLDAAKGLLASVVKICSKAQNSTEGQTMLALKDLSRIHLQQGHSDLAKSCLRKSLLITEARLGKSHPSTQRVRSSLNALEMQK